MPSVVEYRLIKNIHNVADSLNVPTGISWACAAGGSLSICVAKMGTKAEVSFGNTGHMLKYVELAVFALSSCLHILRFDTKVLTYDQEMVPWSQAISFFPTEALCL